MPSCSAHSRRRPLRFAVLATLGLAGLATVPTQGADSYPRERSKPRIQVPASERWRLRPAEPVVPSTTGSIALRPETPIPENRRAVRLVYPALIEAR